MPAEMKAKITELLKQTPKWKELEDNLAYSHLETDDHKADEIFNTILGNEGESSQKVQEIIGKDVKLTDKIKSAINDVWEWVKANIFQNTDAKINQFAKKTLGELLNGEPVYKEGGDVLDFNRRMIDWRNNNLENNEKGSTFVENNVVNKNGDINYDELNKQTNSLLRRTSRINFLSPAEELGRNSGGRRNVEASLLLRREVGSDGSQQSNTRERQEEILTDYAQREGIWISPETINEWKLIGDDVTMEARVYDDGKNVIKVGYNYLNFYDTPLDWLTNKISLNNYLFPDSKLELIGFTETYGATKEVDGKFFAPVYRQEYVKGRVLSDSELPMLEEEMKHLVFTKKGYSSYFNENYVIRDLHVDNVMITDNGNYRFVDTVPFLNTPDQKLDGKREYGDGSIIQDNNAPENISGENNARFQIIPTNPTEDTPKHNPGEHPLDYAKRVTRWLREQAKQKEVSEGQPANYSGKNMVGISHAALNDLAGRIGLPPLERGGSYDPKELADRGRKLLSAGANPKQIEDEFYNKKLLDGNMISVNDQSGLTDLQSQFVDKHDNKFTREEAKAIWNYMVMINIR